MKQKLVILVLMSDSKVRGVTCIVKSCVNEHLHNPAIAFTK